MGKKSDFSPECQKFVKKLFAFFSKEKATKKPILSFDRVYQRTSKALSVSYTSVHRIMNDKRPCRSNRPKERATILDDFDHCVTKRTIHGLWWSDLLYRVSLDFDILIESCISLCIIETVVNINRVIKRTIHGLFTRKIVPTVSIIQKEIKVSIKISKSNLL